MFSHILRAPVQSIAKWDTAQHPRDAKGRFVDLGLHDGLVTVLHGTTRQNAEAILKEGFKPGDPAKVAAQIEQTYGLMKDSILNHVAFQFAKGRTDLGEVHFTTDESVADQYAVPEVVQDALMAAYTLLHPMPEDVPFTKAMRDAQKAWIDQEARRLTEPALLAVTVPFEAVGQHSFGKKLTLPEFQEIQAKFPGTEHFFDNIRIPISALGEAIVQRRKWDESKHPRDTEGQFTETVAAEFRDLEEAWAGGVGDFGDPDAALAIQNHPKYAEYRQGLVDQLTQEHGSAITVYRAVSQDALEGMQAGEGLGPIGVTTDPELAKKWVNFAGNRGRTLTILKTTIDPKIAVMRGKEEESEIVIDGDWVSYHQWEHLGTASEKGFVAKWEEAQHPRDAEGQFTTFYHGTVQEQVDSIKAHGLQTDYAGLAWPGLSQPGTIYLARTKHDATVWAESSAIRLQWKYENPVAVVLEIRVPAEVIAKSQRTTGITHTGEPEGNLRVFQDIPPEWIQSVTVGRSYDAIEGRPDRPPRPPYVVRIPPTIQKGDSTTFYVGLVIEGALVQKWEESQHPRDKEGQFTFWHGSPSGELRGGLTGLHVGTREAAKQALNARIGVPAVGEWDGTRVYGKTLIAGRRTLMRMDPRGYLLTGYNADPPEEDYYPTDPRAEKATYSGGASVSLRVKPDLFPVQITGEMANTPKDPSSDEEANEAMQQALRRGGVGPDVGYYYTEVGEDAGSIAATVPSGAFIERLRRTKKADPASGRYVTPFVSFDKQGDDALRMIASLNSSRLATWGFTAEAEVRGLARYRLTAVLDGRTSKFCRLMDGKIFDVTDARRKVIEALNVQDPEDLRTVQPWPRQDKASMAAFAEMSADELMERGLHIPPYHPYCRTVLRPVQSSAGELDDSEVIPTLPNDVETFQPVTVADLKELGLDATQEQVDQWNAHVGMTPTELLSKLTGVDPQEILTKGQGVGSRPITFEDGNIGFNTSGEVNGIEFKLGALLDPFTGIYYLTRADLLAGTPAAEISFMKRLFTSLIDMGEASTATSVAVNVAGNAAYYAKLGFLPDEIEWDGLRIAALDELETTLQPMLASLTPEDQELVRHLLQDRSVGALSALVELPFTYEGRTIGEWLLGETSGTWALDLTDAEMVEHAKAYLA